MSSREKPDASESDCANSPVSSGAWSAGAMTVIVSSLHDSSDAWNSEISRDFSSVGSASTFVSDFVSAAPSCCLSSTNELSPSAPDSSIDARSSRIASMSRKREFERAGLSVISPLRIRPSRCSPEWEMSRSVENSRKPALPLIVCRMRKMLPSRSASCGFSSSATKSFSSCPSPSLVSIRKSLTKSSSSPISAVSTLC